jgi:hypothetical protein
MNDTLHSQFEASQLHKLCEHSNGGFPVMPRCSGIAYGRHSFPTYNFSYILQRFFTKGFIEAYDAESQGIDRHVYKKGRTQILSLLSENLALVAWVAFRNGREAQAQQHGIRNTFHFPSTQQRNRYYSSIICTVALVVTISARSTNHWRIVCAPPSR